MSTRRRLFTLFALVGAGAVGAAASCTTFNFPYPSCPAGSGYLLIPDAVRLCSLVSTCPGLSVAVSASIALPLDSTSSFTGCVDWVAGSMSTGRPGLALQQQMLQCMAGAMSNPTPNSTPCETALQCAYIRPIIPTSTSCLEGCADGGAGIIRCVDGFALESQCGPPIWGDGGSCVLDIVGVPYCGTTSLTCSRTIGPQCADSTTEYSCNAKASNNYFTFDCNVFGEVCAGTACDSPLAAAPPDGAPPAGPVCSASDQGVTCTSDQRAIRYCNRQPPIRSTFDCSQTGRVCDSEAGVPFCRGSCDTCTPFDPGMGGCSGSTISLCVDGVPTSFDCSSVGLECQPGGYCG